MSKLSPSDPGKVEGSLDTRSPRVDLEHNTSGPSHKFLLPYLPSKRSMSVEY